MPVDEYLLGLERELERRHRDSQLALDTLYLGGGTPSRLGGDGVRRLVDIVRSRAELRGGAEVTLEANPDDVTAAAVRAWREAGINRVSLGVQSFEPTVLAWMHRTHSAVDALNAIHVLREQGLSNISIDLIFGVPGVVDRSWRRELDHVLPLSLAHVSVYGLTVEPHTPLGRWVARRDVAEAPEEAFEAEFLAAHDALEAAGFEHYEVSNYGQPGCHSRHNWAYWLRRPYAGLGPAAHEFDGSTRRWNTGPYTDWVARLASGRTSMEGQEQLGAEAVQSESTYLNLRTNRGLVLGEEEREDVEPWLRSGWATLDAESTLRLTAAGWLRLDALSNHLTLVRSRSYI